MNLRYCTLTGVDEQTDLSKIWKLSKMYPFAEFGVLYSDQPGKGNRYPEPAFIRQLAEFRKNFAVPFSLHFCFDSAYQLLDGSKPLLALAQGFDRIQLNFDYTKKPFEQSKMQDLFEAYKKIIITQHNPQNESVTSFINNPRHHVLVDSSLGNGKEIAHIEFIRRKALCGYAGGISSTNVQKILKKILGVVGREPFWIDMESSLRNTNDQFDVQEADDVLDSVEFFRSSH